MALFGTQRDISMFRHVSRELLGDIITQQVGYYTLKLDQSTTNMYGEALNKYYNGPLLLNCLITRGDQQWGVSELGPNVDRELGFAFLRDDLIDYDLTLSVGDIIMWYENYYEIDSTTENQLFSGKNAEYPYLSLGDFGRSISIICQTHLVPSDKVQITKERVP